jgi:hypothetical protein
VDDLRDQLEAIAKEEHDRRERQQAQTPPAKAATRTHKPARKPGKGRAAAPRPPRETPIARDERRESGGATTPQKPEATASPQPLDPQPFTTPAPSDSVQPGQTPSNLVKPPQDPVPNPVSDPIFQYLAGNPDPVMDQFAKGKVNLA